MDPVRIPYDEMLEAYHRSLNTVLRKFRCSDSHDFFETWVPDDDETMSILNLLEAAKDGGLTKLSLVLGPASWQALDLARLRELASSLGDLEVEVKEEGSSKVLEVSFGPGETALSIHPAYRGNLKPFVGQHAHEGSLLPEADLLLLKAVSDGATLEALVRPTDHLLQKAAYQAPSALEQALLEALCGLIEGRPIQEVAEHSVIYLETQLRDPKLPPPVAGIATPQNADPAFQLPLHLVRELFAQYQQKTGYQEVRNFYHPPASPTWRALSTEEKLDKLRQVMGGDPLGQGVEIIQLEKEVRIVVQFNNSAGLKDKPSQLLQLERLLKEKVEPTLEVYQEPKLDENQPRRTKEVRL